ncbi:MAG: hypothetical protein ACOH5I_07550 [Oligoflexus sp.]
MKFKPNSMSQIFKRLLVCFLVFSPFIAASNAQSGSPSTELPFYPESLLTDHEFLLLETDRAIQSGGETAMIAQDLKELLITHMEKEKQFVFPQLSYLPRLAYEGIVEEAEDLERLTDILRSELPSLFKEHRAIESLAQDLRVAAKKEAKPAQVEYTKHLINHMQQEEEVTYAAALLVGETARLLNLR